MKKGKARNSVTSNRNRDQRAAFKPVVDVVQKYGDDLRRYPGVIGIRPGYWLRDGWFPDPPQPAIVVSVRQKKSPDQLSKDQSLPGAFHGIPVDVESCVSA
jgi:hypothetical protein